MRGLHRWLWPLVTALVCALPGMAHHSFAAEFDANKTVTIKGVVSKVDWVNPHIFIYVDVKDAQTGKVANWACEMGSPNGLTRQGWTRNTFTLGEDIIIEGWQAKNGTNTCNARTWKLADGRVVLAGSSNEAASQSIK